MKTPFATSVLSSFGFALVLGLMLAAPDAIGQQKAATDQPPDAKSQANGKDQLPPPNPLDGRIVRVVYAFAGGGTWGFHLAHMNDGRYCVRFGNPGRLRLATIEKVADICFDRIPETVERSPEQRHRAFDTREKGKVITVVSFHKGAISAAGNDITLDIASCNIVEGEEKAENCSLERNKDRFVVRFEGAGCGAAVTLSNRPRLSGPPTCEHYARSER